MQFIKSYEFYKPTDKDLNLLVSVFLDTKYSFKGDMHLDGVLLAYFGDLIKSLIVKGVIKEEGNFYIKSDTIAYYQGRIVKTGSFFSERSPSLYYKPALKKKITGESKEKNEPSILEKVIICSNKFTLSLNIQKISDYPIYEKLFCNLLNKYAIKFIAEEERSFLLGTL